MQLISIILLAAVCSAVKHRPNQKNAPTFNTGQEIAPLRTITSDQTSAKESKKAFRRSSKQYFAPPPRKQRIQRPADQEFSEDFFYPPQETKKTSKQYLASNDFRQSTNRYDAQNTGNDQRQTSDAYSKDYDMYMDAEDNYNYFPAIDIKKSKYHSNNKQTEYLAPIEPKPTNVYLPVKEEAFQYPLMVETKFATNGYTKPTKKPAVKKGEILDTDNYPTSFKQMMKQNSNKMKAESTKKDSYNFSNQQYSRPKNHNQEQYEFIPSATMIPINVQFTSPSSQNSFSDYKSALTDSFDSNYNQPIPLNQIKNENSQADSNIYYNEKKYSPPTITHDKNYKNPIIVNPFIDQYVPQQSTQVSNGFLPQSSVNTFGNEFLPVQNNNQYIDEYVPSPDSKNENDKYLPPIDVGTVFQELLPSADNSYAAPQYLPLNNQAPVEKSKHFNTPKMEFAADRRDDNSTYRQLLSFNQNPGEFHQNSFNSLQFNQVQPYENDMQFNQNHLPTMQFPMIFSQNNIQANNTNTIQPTAPSVNYEQSSATYPSNFYSYTQGPVADSTVRSDMKHFNNDKQDADAMMVEIGSKNIGHKWRSDSFTTANINEMNSFEPARLNHAQSRQSDSSTHVKKHSQHIKTTLPAFQAHPQQFAAARSTLIPLSVSQDKQENTPEKSAKQDLLLASSSNINQTPGVLPAQFQAQYQGQQFINHKPLHQQSQFPQQQLARTQSTYANGFDHPEYSPTPFSPSYQTARPYTPGPITESIPILKQTSEMAMDGSFSYETLTGDQTHVMQQGHIENAGTDHEEQVIHGSYSYVGDNGITYTVNYVADGNGFRASGDHIPTAPPIPEIIQRSIDLNIAEEAAKTNQLYETQSNQYRSTNFQSQPNSVPDNYQPQESSISNNYLPAPLPAPSNYQPQSSATANTNYQPQQDPTSTNFQSQQNPSSTNFQSQPSAPSTNFQSQASATSSANYQPYTSPTGPAEPQGVANTYPKDSMYKYQNAIN